MSAASTSSATVPVLAASGVSKRFGATVALDGADLVLHAGEVVALMGANGAGKSTLVKILSGAQPADGGTVTVRGAAVAFSSPRAAKLAGIATVHQATEQNGVPGLTVAENLVLDELCGSRSIGVTPSGIRRRAAEIAGLLALDLPLGADFADLGPAERQLVTIARAVAARSSVLILDEPTASLSAPEAERLFAIVRKLAAAGIAILYISHRLGDLAAIADRAVILRNGRVAGEFRRPIDFEAAVATMIGRKLEAAHAGAAPAILRKTVLSIEGLKLAPAAAPIDLELREGEVVAITGALGSGKSRLLRTLFGLEPMLAGTVRLDGRGWRPASPQAAIAGGVFMAGEDRWRSSLLPGTVPGGTIAGTIALPHLRRWFPLGPLDDRRERAVARDAIARLGIRARGPEATLDELSGGNQQKVVLARWQAEPCRVLLLDEPFQGVDVGARADLIAAIRAGRPDGATLIATSDTEEALEVADRILIMRDRSIAGVHAGAELGAGALIAEIGALERDEVRE